MAAFQGRQRQGFWLVLGFLSTNEGSRFQSRWFPLVGKGRWAERLQPAVPWDAASSAQVWALLRSWGGGWLDPFSRGRAEEEDHQDCRPTGAASPTKS